METSSWWTTAAIQRCSQTTPKGYTHRHRHLLNTHLMFYLGDKSLFYTQRKRQHLVYSKTYVEPALYERTVKIIEK